MQMSTLQSGKRGFRFESPSHVVGGGNEAAARMEEIIGVDLGGRGISELVASLKVLDH